MYTENDMPSPALDAPESTKVASSSVVTENIMRKVRAEQVRLIYANSGTAIMGGILMVVVLGSVFWDIVPDALLFTWVTCSIATYLARYYMIYRFWQVRPSDSETPKWQFWYVTGTVCGGIVLGSTSFLILFTDSVAHQLFTLFIIGIMVTGAVSSLTAIMTAYVYYTIIAMVPSIIIAQVIGHSVTDHLSLVMAVLTLVMLGMGRHINKRIINSLMLKFENDHLIDNLSEAKEHLQNTNESLEAEIAERKQRENDIYQQQLALLNLATCEPIKHGDLHGALQIVTETATRVADVDHASVWLFEDNNEILHSIHTYDRKEPVHGRNLSAERAKFPTYFDAINQDRVLAVEDVHTDPRLSDFPARYFSRGGITSLLHAPVRLEGKVIGLVCLEHVGEKRAWSLEEKNFASSLGDMVALALDHNQRKKVEADLIREKGRAQSTLASIGDGVITTDVAGGIQYINPVAEKLTGWSIRDAEGLALNDILWMVNETNREPISDAFERYTSHKHDPHLFSDLILINRLNHAEYSVQVTSSPMCDRDGTTIGLVLVLHDVTELRGLAHKLSYQATHDALTGLINRHEFETLLEKTINLAVNERRENALLYIDLDQFKVVNDTCGHLAGDELLKQISMVLQKAVRHSDVLARLGGDEFGVLLKDCDLSNATRVANEMRQSIKDFRFEWDNKSFDIGSSIGLVSVTADSGNLSEVMSAADAACYVAKDTGRNRVHIYLPDDKVIAERHGEMRWVHRIKHALEEDRFCLYYQPVALVHPGKRKFLYCEMLVRMLDEQGALVPPMSFIPAAERYQLMPEIDRWVLRHTLDELRKDDSILSDYAVVAINLSGQSLGNSEFLDGVFKMIADAGVAPERICLEITETAAISNFQSAIQFINSLREMGCRFALDDFGSGVSSFGYLKSLSVDYLKIDGRFVKDMVSDPIDYAMVDAINRIGHVMGIETIAEFVENDEIMAALSRLGVDHAQGFGVERPKALQSAVVHKLQANRKGA